MLGLGTSKKLVTFAYNFSGIDIMANISAILRHRIGRDGDGVTTLVVFMMCPLHCKYCLNPQTLSHQYPSKIYSAEQLYNEVKIDDLYFRATGGGITFGGGEPLLNSKFIKEFKYLCGKDWKINVETSLNVEMEHLLEVVDCVDSFIIDIKDMDKEIYLSYTEKDNSIVLENLKYLVSVGMADSCVIRVPLIPGFNKETNVESSIKLLKTIGLSKFDKFIYIAQRHGKRKKDL